MNLLLQYNYFINILSNRVAKEILKDQFKESFKIAFGRITETGYDYFSNSKDWLGSDGATIFSTNTVVIGSLMQTVHETSNDNGLRAIKFAASKKMRIISAMITHRKTYKQTWFPLPVVIETNSIKCRSAEVNSEIFLVIPIVKDHKAEQLIWKVKKKSNKHRRVHKLESKLRYRGVLANDHINIDMDQDIEDIQLSIKTLSLTNLEILGDIFNKVKTPDLTNHVCKYSREKQNFNHERFHNLKDTLNQIPKLSCVRE